MTWWLILAQLLVAFVGGLISAGILVAIGGMGAIRQAQNTADSAKNDLAVLEDRLTRHQKRVASAQGVAAKEETRSLKEEAEAHLAGNERDVKPRRPSVIQLLRR